MTPRNPWRRRNTFREIIHPLLWWFLFVALMFVAVDLLIDRVDQHQQAEIEQVAPERWLIV